MPVSKKQQACVHRYTKTHYDRLQLTAPKGYHDIIQSAAAARGLSINGYIMDAIRAALAADGVTLPTTAQDDGDGDAADQADQADGV